MTPAATLGAASLYDQSDYLRIAAAALDAEVEIAERAGATLALLACPDGVRRTAPGLPRPYGSNLAGGLGELARELTEPEVRIVATLSPLESGPELARELVVRGARLIGDRPMCVIELHDDDPDACLDPETRRRLASAQGESRVEVAPLDERFDEFQRSPRRGPSFAGRGVVPTDRYVVLAACEHYFITVLDADGIAAAALFLHDGRESYCHSGSVRGELLAAQDTVRLALAAGVREAARLGCRVVVLGGGLSDRRDDPLLELKREFATAVLPRFTVTTDGA